MGFNICAGFGILLGVAAVVLVIFGEIAQINGSTVPRHLRIVAVDASGLGRVTGYGAALYYNTTTSSTSAVNAVAAGGGLRPWYESGYWNACAHQTLGSVPSYCQKSHFGYAWTPAREILQDVPQQYQAPVQSFLGNVVFTDANYTGKYTQAANYLIFVGAIMTGVAMLIGLLAHRFAFLVGALAATLAAVLLGVGLVIWTVIIARAKSSVNFAEFGIAVKYGNALWISWAACGCMFLAILPYLFACCAGRRDTY